ncbi:hypothetical protein BKA56DRAFT_488152 [Ilyonectria sp. MPI-CAGE-AT-0026]|nr:hypothetical protein BKA56DRAFT_488152 [Ilyonectria sp. MPI-CAGE-AT-0026]
MDCARLASTENTLREITSQLKSLTKQLERSNFNGVENNRSFSNGLYLSDSETFGDSLEQVLDPADRAVHSAPVVVLRDLDRRYTGGYRRPRVLTDIDLVEAQLLDEQMAKDLIQIVCCLHAFIYRDDIFDTPMHRKIYEHVRISLGKILLSIPLTIEDIHGVFLMSENVMAGPGNSKEYIDSWMLTGYCIKQAMLSISFSEIVENIRKDIPTPEDQRAIRLWSTISLDHLYWAATTGRPSAIPNAYLKHCDLLLSFYKASMQDGMLLAEILLCTTLLQKLGGHTVLDREGQCVEFTAWKQKWNHLLSMPTASMLRIGYFSACLILIIRSLEDLGENLQSTTLLSSSSNTNSNGCPASTEKGTAKDATRASLRSNASKHAQSIMETFLNMPSSLRNSIASNRCLCLGYSALILTHYDEAQSSISDEHKLNLITRFEEWLTDAPGAAWAVMFGKLAKQKLMTRVHSSNSSQRDGQGAFSRTEARRTAMMTPTDGASVWSTPAPLSYEFQPDFVFPNMEDFFSGGFLDFGGLE